MFRRGYYPSTSSIKSALHVLNSFSFLLAKPIQDVDVVFAISATASDAQQTFSVMREVIKSIFEKHGVDSIRPAIIVFGDEAYVRLNFDEDVTDLNVLKRRIDNLPRNRGTPDLVKALSLAKTVFSGVRPNARKVLVIISDNRSDSKSWKIRSNARELEEEEIEVIPVGIGAEVDLPQLKDTTPHKANLIPASKDDDVDDLGDKILDIMLKSK